MGRSRHWIFCPPVNDKPLNPGTRPVRKIRSHQPIDDLILRQARRTPEQVALVCGDQRVNYGELVDQSTVCWHALAQRRIASGDVVAICLPRGVETPIWMLAVLRTGAAYLLLGYGISASSPSDNVEPQWRGATGGG